MGNFLKKLFKDDKRKLNKDEVDMLNRLSQEIMKEEGKRNKETSIETSKLPQVPNNITTEVPRGFGCYQFYSCTHPGMIKESNQDSIFTGEVKYNNDNKILHIGIGIVADGMGGLALGELASSTAIASVNTYINARISEYIQKGIPEKWVILSNISDAIQNANRLVKDKGNEVGESIGTTFTLTLLIGNDAYFGHVGDSRAYLIDLEHKSMDKITRDHSLVGRLIEIGQISEKEAKSHPRRNEIYRMLGLRDELEVDTYYKRINKNSIIVLVSDGLWEFIDDNDVLNYILENNELSQSAKKLVSMANSNGGQDNISIIIIKPIE